MRTSRRVRVCRFTALLGACVIVLMPAAGRALMSPKSVEQLASEAHAIVEGHVAEVESVWSPDHTQIYTWVTIDVRQQHKGAGMGSVLKLRIFGGEIDGVGMTVDESPAFTRGDDVVLFLGVNPQAFFPTVGMGQGVFVITRDARSGHEMATNSRGVTIDKSTLESRIQGALAAPGARQ